MTMTTPPLSQEEDKAWTALCGRVERASAPDGMMPVLCLWQPFASLIVAGVKRRETRGWRMPERMIGRDIAIHATATFPAPKHISEELHELCVDTFGCYYNGTLPQGGLISIVRIEDCVSTDERGPLDEPDRIAGDYGPGRFSSTLGDPRELPGLLPVKGRQGWWRYPLLSALRLATGDRTS